MNIARQKLVNSGSRRFIVQAPFMTIAEVADLLMLGKRTVYQLAREGRLGGAAKVGGRWRFERAALEAWLRNGGEAGYGEKKSA